MSKLPAGTLVDGRYRVLGLLGEGGMGAVYEAQDLELGRIVALKVMQDDEVQDDVIERLAREARAAARVGHPNVINIFEYSDDPELAVHYIAMEKLEGTTVAQQLADGILPVALIERLALTLCDALSTLHRLGIIHRDLKPSNVFLAKRGRRENEIVLLDFGVARQYDAQTLTMTGQRCGTVMYMAPEQVVDSRSADARSDIYGLGALLFECATGKTPFRAKTMPALIKQVLRGDVFDVRAHRSELPAALAHAIERCLRTDPAERYASANALYDELCGAGLASQ